MEMESEKVLEMESEKDFFMNNKAILSSKGQPASPKLALTKFLGMGQNRLKSTKMSIEDIENAIGPCDQRSVPAPGLDSVEGLYA